MNAIPVQPAPWLNPALRWRALDTAGAPAGVRAWLADSGSLTRRLQRRGRFRVAPRGQRLCRPRAEEARLLGLRPREAALVREVLLLLDDQPVVHARSVLPLATLRRGNQRLGHMAGRSLGAELFRRPRARRRAVWAARVPPAFLPPEAGDEAAWGRLSLFHKRDLPLLVAEVFLPALWREPRESLD